MTRTKKQKLAVSSFIALVIAQILWGINTPVIKLGLETVPLALFLSVTILGAALLILLIARRRWVPLKTSDYALLVTSSIISITLGNVALLMGIHRVPSINATLIGLFGPLLIFMLSVQFLKERLSVKTFIGILVAFVGAAVIVVEPSSAGGQQALIGNMLLILAVLCDVVGTLICKPVLKRANTYQVTFIHLFAGILPVTVFSLQYLSVQNLDNIGGRGFAAILYNTLAVAIANCLFMYGLKHRKAQDVGIFDYIHPIVTAIAAWFILNEVPDKKVAIGAILIFGGVYVAEIMPNKRWAKRRQFKV